jgi:hypothetical protein
VSSHRNIVVGLIAVASISGCSGGGTTLSPAAASVNVIGATTPTPAAATPSPGPAASATPTAKPAASPTPTAKPTASPTPSATPKPASAIAASPSMLAFTNLGTPAAQTLAASESGYAGAFSETDTCAGLATVAPASVPTGKPFTVTPVAVGTCTITVHGATGVSLGVTVNVTQSVLVIQKAGRGQL